VVSENGGPWTPPSMGLKMPKQIPQRAFLNGEDPVIKKHCVLENTLW